MATAAKAKVETVSTRQLAGQLAAIGIGTYFFHGSSEITYRRVAYVIIMLAAVLSLPVFDGLFAATRRHTPAAAAPTTAGASPEGSRRAAAVICNSWSGSRSSSSRLRC